MSQQLQEAITRVFNMDDDELMQVIQAVKQRRQWLSKMNIRSVVIGDTVTFTARGRVVTGTVTKVNVKNVKVKDGSVMWNVPANMLTIVKQEIA